MLSRLMQRHSHSFEALGTKWDIATSVQLHGATVKAVQKRVESFDKTYSRFRDDSLVTEISKKPGKYLFPDDARKLFSVYAKLYEKSEGKVTPLIGDMVSQAGYDATYSFAPRSIEPIRGWDESMEWDGKALTTKRPIILDFGAAGKGYLVDLLASILDSHGIKDYVIDASGDMRHKGSIENKVGLEHPLDPTRVIGIIDVQDESLCASATNRRTWGNGLHHVFDPHTKAPTNTILATWVVADEAIVADGLATALFFSEPKNLMPYFDFEYVRVYTNGTLEYSPLFEGKLF